MVGGNFGGPVWIPKVYNGKDKTFFVSYERTSTSKKSTTTGQTITNAERTGDFTNSPDGIPVINGVPTPIIPTSDFGTLGMTLNSSAGTAVMPAPTSGVDTFTWNPSDVSLVQTWVVRVDENLGSKQRLFASLWMSNDSTTFQDMYDEFSEASWATQYPNPAATWGEPVKTKVWAVNDTYQITPSMLNNFVLGLTQTAISITNTCAPCSGDVNPANTGINAVGDTDAPDIDEISTPRSMGVDIWNGYINPMTQFTWDITDNFTWTKGRHTFKAGLELRNFHENFLQTYDSGADVTFSDSDIVYGGTGNGIADMMLNGGPLGQFGASFHQNNTEKLNINYPARNAYVQDSMKLNPRLNVMLGVRLQPYFGIRSVNNDFVTFRPGQQSSVFPTAPTGLVTVGDSDVPSNLTGDRYNVLPRVSFAWDIRGNGRSALKGGFGQYTDYQYTLGFNGYTTQAPYGVDYSPAQGPGLSLSNPYAQYGSVPFPYTPPVPGSAAADTYAYPLPLTTQSVAPGYNSGQYYKSNLEYQIEPIKTWVFSAAWVATRGTHLSETHNLNWPRFVPGGSTNDAANVFSREPYYPAGFNQIDQFFSDYNSMYNSLQVEIRKRLSHGLTLLGNYTLSNSTAQQGCRYEADCALDYYSPGAVSAMALAFRYSLPDFPGRSWMLQRALGAWILGGSVNASTGGYGSVADYDCAQFNFGSATCYANYTGGGALLANRKTPVLSGGSEIGVGWLNPSKFVRADQDVVNGTITTIPGQGQRLFLGTLELASIRGPHPALRTSMPALIRTSKLPQTTALVFSLKRSTCSTIPYSMDRATTTPWDRTRWDSASSAPLMRQGVCNCRFTSNFESYLTCAVRRAVRIRIVTDFAAHSYRCNNHNF